jgi:TetR/AcrR family transcriptional regulator
VSEISAERISPGARRESILAAASRVFGERGYFGATTDQIAQAAGISQPYVVRMFGGKEALFLAVLARAVDTLTRRFREVIAESEEAQEGPEELHLRLAQAYADLIEDRGLLLSLMHAFTMGHDPVIGQTARDGFLEVYRLIREQAHMSAEKAHDFLAGGMLFNTLVALRLTDEYGVDATATELITVTFGTKLETVLCAEDRTSGALA